MIPTYGLTHISLAVRDLDRAYGFYHRLFGVEEYYRDDESIHATTPGHKDVITFTLTPDDAGAVGGVAHFGFRLVSPDDIDAAVTQAGEAGGTLLRRGEFAPGFPYAYVADPDGYEVEIWYE